MKLEHFNKEMINSLVNQKNIDTIELILKEENILTKNKIELINILYYLKLSNFNNEKILVKSEKRDFEFENFYLNLTEYFEVDSNTDPGNLMTFIKDSIETNKFLNKKYKRLIKNFEKEKKKLNLINKQEKKKIVEYVNQLQKKNSDLKNLVYEYEKKNENQNLELKLKNEFKQEMKKNLKSFKEELNKKKKMINTLKQKNENIKFKFYSKIVFQNQIIKNLCKIINYQNQKSIIPNLTKNINILTYEKSEMDNKSQISIILPANQNISIKSDFANPRKNRLTNSSLNKTTIEKKIFNSIKKINKSKTKKDLKKIDQKMDKSLLEIELVKENDDFKQRNNLEIKLMYYYKLSSHNENEFFEQLKILNEEFIGKIELNIEEAIEFYLFCKKFVYLKIEDNESIQTILKDKVFENSFEGIDLKVLEENFENGTNLNDVLKKFSKMKEVIYFYTKNLSQREKQIQILNLEIDENNCLIQNLKAENEKNSKLLGLQNDVKMRKLEEQNLILQKKKINLFEEVQDLRKKLNILEKKYSKLENKNKLEAEKNIDLKNRNEEKLKNLFEQIEKLQIQNFDFLKLKLELENNINKLNENNNNLSNSEKILYSQLENLNKEKQNFLKQNQILENKVVNLIKNLEEIKEEKINLNKKNEKLNLALDESNKINEKLEKEKDNFKKDIKNLEEKLENVEKEFKKKKNEFTEKINNLENEKFDLKNNIQNLEKEKTQLNLDLKKKEEENNEKNKKLLEFKKEKQEMELKLNKLENEKNNLSLNLKNIENKNNQLEENLNNLKTEKEDLIKEKEKLKETVESEKKIKNTLLKNEELLNNQVSNLTEIKQTLDEEKKMLLIRKQKLESDNVNLEKIKETIVTKLDLNTNKKNEFEKKVENLHLTIDDLKTKIKKLQNNLDEKKNTVSSLNKKIQKLITNLEILREEKKIFINQIKEKNDLITKITEEIKKQVNYNTELKTYLRENKEILNLLKDDKNKERENLEKELENKNNTISKNELKIKNLLNQIKDFEEQMRNLKQSDKMKNQEYLELKKKLKNQKKTNINVYKENEEKMENMENDLIGVEERINEIKDVLKNFENIKSNFKDKHSQFKNIIIWIVNKFEDLKMLYNDLLHKTTLKIMDLHQDKLKLLKIKLKKNDFNFESFISNKELRNFLGNLLNIDVKENNRLFFDKLNTIFKNNEIYHIYSKDLELKNEKADAPKHSAMIKQNLQTLIESYKTLKKCTETNPPNPDEEKTAKEKKNLKKEEMQDLNTKLETITNFQNNLKTLYSQSVKYKENYKKINFHKKIFKIITKNPEIDIKDESSDYTVLTIENSTLLTKYKTFTKEFQKTYSKKLDTENLYFSITSIISFPLKKKYDDLQFQYKETLFLNDKATSKFLQFRDDIMRLNSELEEKEMIILKLEQSKNVKVSKSPSLMKKKIKNNANFKNKNQKKLISEMEKKLVVLKNILRALGINPKEKNLNDAFMKRVEELKINKDDIDFTVFKTKVKRKEKNFTRYGEELQSFLQVSEKIIDINLFKDDNGTGKKVPFFLDNSADSIAREPPKVDMGSEKNNVFIKDFKRSKTKN